MRTPMHTAVYTRKGVEPGADSSLAAHVRRWLWHLSDDGVHPAGVTAIARLAQRVLRFMRTAPISVVAVFAFTALELADLLQAESREQTRVPLRTFLGGFSSIVAQLILVNRTPIAREALQLAASAAGEVERLASPSDKARLEKVARSASLRTRFLVIYSVLTQVGVYFTLLTDTGSHTARWVSVTGGALLSWAWMLFTLYSIIVCHTCLYTLLTLQLTLNQACCTLYEQIGQRYKVLGGTASTASSVALHGKVNESSRLLSKVFDHQLPQFHTVSLVLPMVSTAEVILAGGRTDSFALAMVPLIFTFFVSQCMAGQKLTDHSEDIGWAAYQGPWLIENIPSRRSRLLVIQSTSRPAFFGVSGMVELNHRSCERALRVWFQYLQILLNTSGRGGMTRH